MSITRNCAPLGDGICDGFFGDGLSPCECACHEAWDLPQTVEGVRDWHDAENGVQRDQVRTYVIGLPVVISVHPDGRVTAEVDLSEAADLHDSSASRPDGVDDDQVDADIETVSNAVIQVLA